MNKKVKVTINFTDNIDCICPDTKIYIEENLKKMLIVEELIYFVFEFFVPTDVLLFNEKFS